MKSIFMVMLMIQSLLGWSVSEDMKDGNAGKDRVEVKFNPNVHSDVQSGTDVQPISPVETFKLSPEQMEKLKKQKKKIDRYSDLAGNVDFDVMIPSHLPDGFELAEIRKVNERTVQFKYEKRAELLGTIEDELILVQSVPDPAMERMPEVVDEYGSIVLKWGEAGWTRNHQSYTKIEWEHEGKAYVLSGLNLSLTELVDIADHLVPLEM